jgi:hypothetical protein
MKQKQLLFSDWFELLLETYWHLGTYSWSACTQRFGNDYSLTVWQSLLFPCHCQRHVRQNKFCPDFLHSFFNKKMNILTDTFGSEFTASFLAAQPIINHHNTLRIIGTPLVGRYFMFSYNVNATISSSIHNSNHNKCHSAFSTHYVTKCIVAKLFTPYIVCSNWNLLIYSHRPLVGQLMAS